MKRAQPFLLPLAIVFAATFGGVAVLNTPTAQAERFEAVAGGSGWNVSAPGVNTDAFASDIVWGNDQTCRVVVQCATSTVVNLMIKRNGVEKPIGLNSNTALVAGAGYVLDWPGMKPGDIVNFQVETDSVIDALELGAVVK